MTFSAKYRASQAANYLQLLQGPDFCDVTFVIGQQKEEIGAHRLLLATVSPVFKRLLLENVEEEKKTNKKQKVEMGDINVTAFECVLKYAYWNDPKLNEDNIASVKNICDQYQISSLSALCDEYIEKKKIKNMSMSMSKKNIKNVRKQVINAYKKDKTAKDDWNGVTKKLKYGKYKNRRIGQFAVHHILDSDGIRDKMGAIIPSECRLKFTFDPINKNEYKSLEKAFRLSDKFEHESEMIVCIDDRLYNSQLCIDIKGTEHSFWCKSIGKSALDHAMGIEVCAYVMRYRPQIAIHFENDDFLMVLSGSNVGVGFCNLFERKNKVSGHQMIQFEQGDMDEVKVEFFGRIHTPAHISDIKMKLKSKKLKDGGELSLFDGSYLSNNNNKHRNSNEILLPDGTQCPSPPPPAVLVEKSFERHRETIQIISDNMDRLQRMGNINSDNIGNRKKQKANNASQHYQSLESFSFNSNANGDNMEKLQRIGNKKKKANRFQSFNSNVNGNNNSKYINELSQTQQIDSISNRHKRKKAASQTQSNNSNGNKHYHQFKRVMPRKNIPHKNNKMLQFAFNPNKAANIERPSRKRRRSELLLPTKPMGSVDYNNSLSAHSDNTSITSSGYEARPHQFRPSRIKHKTKKRKLNTNYRNRKKFESPFIPKETQNLALAAGANINNINISRFAFEPLTTKPLIKRNSSSNYNASNPSTAESVASFNFDIPIATNEQHHNHNHNHITEYQQNTQHTNHNQTNDVNYMNHGNFMHDDNMSVDCGLGYALLTFDSI